MSNQFSISAQHPPQDWPVYMQTDTNLFYSTPWLNVLEGCFNTSTYFLQDVQKKNGYCLSVFSKGPFKIGYINFPVGICSTLPFSLTDSIQCIKHEGIAHIVNLPVSSSCHDPAEYSRDPDITRETIIHPLSDWNDSVIHDSVRGSLKKASKTDFELFYIDDSAYSSRMFELYRETIRYHRGNLRYSPEYFRLLTSLPRETENLRISGLRANDGTLVAFVVTAFHEGTAFYLHGLHDRQYNSCCPIHPLLHDAISHARSRDVHSFNFMTSPPDQTGLVTFKERWGGKTYDHKTCQFRLDATMSTLFSIARMIKDRVPWH